MSDNSNIKKETTIDNLSKRLSNMKTSDTVQSGLSRDVSMFYDYSLEDALNSENKEDTIKKQFEYIKKLEAVVKTDKKIEKSELKDEPVW